MIGFGTPLLLWGAALVAVPILIHLLNRRRYVVKPFAAMAFLQQAWAKRRRRMRMENLLLLLLRCLVVLLAALAMALPFVSSDSPLAALSGGRRDLVLVVDRSGSTDLALDASSRVSDRAVELVRRRLGRLSDERGDAVTILTPGATELLAAPLGAPPTVALAALDDGLPAPGGVADLVAALRVIGDRVRPATTGRLDVEILTDLQEVSVSAALGPVFAEIQEQGETTLKIVDLLGAGSPVASNLGVESLAADRGLLLAGETTSFSAVIRNHGDDVRRAVRGHFELDGEVVRRVEGLEVPPRGVTGVALPLRIDEPGAHHLRFELEGDELPFDDARSLAFETREAIDVLLVDGRHGADRRESATGFLELALAPELELASGDDLGLQRYRTQVMDTRRFEEAGRELWDWDAIVLADVGGLTELAVENLTRVVETGTPLLVFTGEGVRPRFYAEQLSELLPCVIGPMQGDPSGGGEMDYVTLALPDPPPASLELFADPRLAVLLQVPVLAWSALTPDDDAEVLASFVDALGHVVPAVVAGQHGLGRVVVVGTSADDSWSLLPRHPATWLPFVHELIGALAARDPALVNVPVGQAPSLIVSGKPVRARLENGGVVQDLGSPEVEALGERSRLSLAATPLDTAGPWTLDLEFADPAREPLAVALAALPDAREGDLRRVDAATLTQRLAGVEFVLEEAAEQVDDEDGSALDGGDGSLFRALLWALLALALGESVLARFMGGAR